MVSGTVDPAIGLCSDCQHCRIVKSERSTFYMCRLSLTNPEYPQIPAIAGLDAAPAMQPPAPSAVEGRRMISSLNEASILSLDGRAALAVGAAVSSACAEEPTASAQAPPTPTNPDQVVAEVAGKPITLKDVDAKWEQFDAAERARVIQAMYQNRRNMIEQLVGDIAD